MLSPLLFLVLVVGVSARVLPRQTSCGFQLTAIGEPNGTVGETTIGQNRIGGTYPQGSYHFSEDGHTLFDSLNHNCAIFTANLQFQCVQGASGATNFTIAPNFDFLHDGSDSWLACPANGPGEDGSFNIFSDSAPSQPGCEVVTLRTGGFCTAMGRPASSSSSSSATSIPTLVSSANYATFSAATGTAASISSASYAASSSTPTPPSTPSVNDTSPSSTSSAAVCPTDISAGAFLAPTLIVPTSPQAPNISFGISYKAYISPLNNTLFNFDIPSAMPYTGDCSLLFLFPYGSDLDPSAGTYYFSGVEEEEGEQGGIDFALLQSSATSSTTYSSTSSPFLDYGKTEIIPGHNYTIGTFPCQSGQTISYQASSVGNVELDYFQDSAPAPIGLYIVPCA